MDIYDKYSRFDPSNKIHETAIIYDNVKMGKNNVIGPYTVIGSNGEIRGVNEFNGHVTIGNGNVISEHVSIQCPSDSGKSTTIGDNCIIMAHTHIGHDATIGNNVELSTSTVIGGYATIKDGAKIKLGVIVRNRKTIGENAIVGMGAVVVKDVEPKQIVIGNPAKPFKK